ncbi:MAG: aminotransferase class V-fold PLP-dependent enzyme [Planctomycetota bacterium]
MIYLDNAATSWPKPDCVHEAMLAFLRDVGASPGRSGHRLSIEAERFRFDAREALAELFGVSDPMRVIFTLNATQALNLVIRGLLPSGSHVVTTSMEHNSVMRPLAAAERRGVSVSLAPCRTDGSMDPDELEQQVRPDTRLIVANHASNVCGTVLPIRTIGAIARRRGIPFLLDAAQTAGCRPINFAEDNIDLLAFSGHKTLLGPSGTGGLVISDGFDIAMLPPLTEGGTGSASERESQPEILPDKYESGTPNSVGLAGLAAGVRYVLDRGVERIREHEQSMTCRLIVGLRRIPGVCVKGTEDADARTAAVSFTVDGRVSSEIAHALDERFDIMCRPGLQCAPRAHRTLGTFPQGTVRLSPGPFTTPAEIDQALEAVAALTRTRPND